MDSSKTKPSGWSLFHDQYDPDDEGRREAIFALGNGYLMIRAAAPESKDDRIHYPGTYRVGCYNRLSSNVNGQEMENESLVNLPNWLSLTFRIKEGLWFSLDDVEILEYRQELDMKEAILHRKVYFRDQSGRLTKLRERRFVSMAQPHLMGLELELVPQNWSGELEVYAALDGRVINNNVRRYAPFKSRHLKTLSAGRVGKDMLELRTITVKSGIEIALTTRTRIHTSKKSDEVDRVLDSEEDCVGDRFHVSVETGDRIVIEKLAALYTSRDLAIAECREAAQQVLDHAEDFETLLAPHICAWKQLWHRCRMDLNLKEHRCFFRFHMFQILQNLSPFTADIDVGVPPSGWQGEEYHGQIFWDELFVFQFLTFRFPAIARSVLMYRYRRLNQARNMAKENGYGGAMFPWRSASSGREETPLFQLNPISGHWLKDDTRLQRHIGAVVAYSICHYVELTGDQVFLEDYGAELLVEIARFWASKSRFNSHYNRYEILEVVGPDEYHTRYPDKTKINGSAPAEPSSGEDPAGINNNTYTNVMAVWTLFQARRFFDRVSPQRQQELWEVLGLRKEEFDHWDEVSRKMRIVFEDEGILSQFEGFSSLEHLDLSNFRRQHGKQRIDWALEAVGDTVARYQVSKQADTSVLLYLFSPEELISIFDRLGYSVSKETLKRTVHYHMAHTANESSLSRIVNAGALALLDPETSWDLFEKAQLIDLLPDEHHDSSEGIHLGAMGGTLVVLQYYYLGLRIQEGVLMVSPAFPEKLKWVLITLYFRGVEIEYKISRTHIIIRSIHKKVPMIEVGFGKEIKKLYAGTSVSFEKP